MIMRLCLWTILMITAVYPSAEKIIQVPMSMTVELIVADEKGLYNGTHPIRARLFDMQTRERLWAKDYSDYTIKDGSVVIVMDPLDTVDPYDFYRGTIAAVITIGTDTIEVPLVTDFYAYRAVFSEYGFKTRFPDIFYVDHDKEYVGIGTQAPANVVAVNGAIKIGYERTDVLGAIRWDFNSLWVKHDDEWVDMLYVPQTFQASRWRRLGQSIELVSPNYRIGVGVDIPQETMDIRGTLYAEGNLRATTLDAPAVYVNQTHLSTTDWRLQSIEFIQPPSIMEWTPERLRLTHGPITGDGSGLTKVGMLEKDFELGMIQQSHLALNTLEGRNIAIDAIGTNHIAPESIQGDRFSPGIFTENHIKDAAIGAGTIADESLRFTIIKDHDVNDYISDQFFSSRIIADNSVYTVHFQDQRIDANTIATASISADYVAPNTVAGAHIADEAIVFEALATDTIVDALFSGILPLTKGGTGITTMATNRVVHMGPEGMAATAMYMDAGNNIGLYDELNLTAVEQDFRYTFEVGSLYDGITTQFKHPMDQPVMARFVNDAYTLGVGITAAGHWQMAVNNSGLTLASPTQFAIGAVSEGDGFQVNGGMTIGDSANTAPELGTVEYSNGSFGFWNGNWHVMSSSGQGIGSPIAVGGVLRASDALIGTYRHSAIAVQNAQVLRADTSTIRGQRVSITRSNGSQISGHDMQIGRADRARIRGSELQVGSVDRATLYGDHMAVMDLNHSRVYGTHQYVRSVANSYIQGDAMVHEAVANTVVSGNALRLQGVRDSRIQGRNHWVASVQDTVLDGDANALNGVQNAMIYGAHNDVATTTGTRILGDSNRVWGGSNHYIDGVGNTSLYGEVNTIRGSDNRVIADGVIINGSDNTVIGHGARVHGDGNIVLNTMPESLDVWGDDQVVMNTRALHIVTGEGMVVSATPESGGWTMVSDRHQKTHIQPANSLRFLAGIADLPVQKWSYNHTPDTRHMGPMAQAFHAQFGLGDSDQWITASDADGVAFAALTHMIRDMDTWTQPRPSMDMAAIVVALDRIEAGFPMMSDAIRHHQTTTMARYRLIDNQLKILAKQPQRSGWDRICQWGQLIGAIILGIAIGFYTLNRYHK